MSSYDSPYFRYSLLLREVDNLRFEEDVSTIALLLIKLDGLQEVNKRFGFLGGDKVVEEISSRIGAIARERDNSFEISGTAFAMLIRNPVDASHAVLAAQKIAKVTASPVAIGTGLARVKARIGIAMLSDTTTDAEELLHRCESALSDSRERDESYVVFDSESPPVPESSTDVNFDLTQALEQGQMELYYQPKIHLSSRRLAGAEALIRWNSPRAGTLSPEHFLATVETAARRQTLFWFVLNAALRCTADWIEKIPDFTTSINVSAENLHDPDLPEVMENALKIWNVPAQQIVLEITETTFMCDAGANVGILNKLRNIGVRTAIDDFGAGYSSLNCLKDLPADELKIDPSFIGPIVTDDTDRRIVESIIQLAHAVGLEVVAEGVEDAETLDALLAMGCDIGQGFYFAKPLTAGEFSRQWIEKFAAAAVRAAQTS